MIYHVVLIAGMSLFIGAGLAAFVGTPPRPWSWRRYLTRVAFWSTLLPVLLGWTYLVLWAPDLAEVLLVVGSAFVGVTTAIALARAVRSDREASR